jgi:RHS repeat-associated protein
VRYGYSPQNRLDLVRGSTTGKIFQESVYDEEGSRWARVISGDGGRGLLTLRDGSGQVAAEYVESAPGEGPRLSKYYIRANGRLVAIHKPKAADDSPVSAWDTVSDPDSVVGTTGATGTFLNVAARPTGEEGETASASPDSVVGEAGRAAARTGRAGLMETRRLVTSANGRRAYRATAAWEENIESSSLASNRLPLDPEERDWSDSDDSEERTLGGTPPDQPIHIQPLPGTGGGGPDPDPDPEPQLTTEYVVTDHLGSTRLVLNDTGSEIARYKYYPFGHYAELSGGSDVRMKFTGHERDESLGLDYMLARYYGANLGRFLAVDPAGDSAFPGNPRTWNRYAYVQGNPLRFVDPTGMYGRGTGFTDEQWKKFDKSQQKAAKKMEKKAAKLDKKAAKLEEKGKTEKAADRRTAADNLSAGAAVLRSDGSDGRKANAVNSATYQSMGGTANGAAFVNNNGPVVTVNIDHAVWESGGMMAQWAIGHESLHTAGLSDQKGSNKSKAYKYGTDSSRAAFQELKGTPLALVNPDHLMDMVY